MPDGLIMTDIRALQKRKYENLLTGFVGWCKLVGYLHTIKVTATP